MIITAVSFWGKHGVEYVGSIGNISPYGLKESIFKAEFKQKSQSNATVSARQACFALLKLLWSIGRGKMQFRLMNAAAFQTKPHQCGTVIFLRMELNLQNNNN